VNQSIANEFVAVSLDQVRRVVRVTRSAERATSIEQITSAFGEAAQAMQHIDRQRYRLLIDLRAAPGRNDPAFENAMAKQRAALMSGFSAVAILVQTATGQLQVARIGREDGLDVTIFTDESKAVAWLEAQSSLRPPW
jgi:hypothetical protein